MLIAALSFLWIVFEIASLTWGVVHTINAIL